MGTFLVFSLLFSKIVGPEARSLGERLSTSLTSLDPGRTLNFVTIETFHCS